MVRFKFPAVSILEWLSKWWHFERALAVHGSRHQVPEIEERIQNRELKHQELSLVLRALAKSR